MKANMSEVHPELQAGINKIPQFTFARWNLWLLRGLLNLLPAPKLPESLTIEDVFVPVADSQTKIRLRVYRPKATSSMTPVLLWMHGGGYIIGKPEMDDGRCIQFVQELGIVVVSVDYRLAPKYPFPTPLEDTYTALKWVYAQAKQLGIDPARMAIGGESAGAGLAAALAQLALDRNEIKLIFQLLVYPMLDDKTVIRTDLANKVHINWTLNSNRFGWESYLGNKPGTSDLPAYAVPSRRSNLSGLPPAWIGVGTLDLFHDEDVAYAQKLKDDGVECELVIIPGGFHGFDTDVSPQVVQDFRKSQIAALKRYLTWGVNHGTVQLGGIPDPF